MSYQNDYLQRNLYTLELQHQVCKEHVEGGIKLADLVRKYKLTSPYGARFFKMKSCCWRKRPLVPYMEGH